MWTAIYFVAFTAAMLGLVPWAQWSIKEDRADNICELEKMKRDVRSIIGWMKRKVGAA